MKGVIQREDQSRARGCAAAIDDQDEVGIRRPDRCEPLGRAWQADDAKPCPGSNRVEGKFNGDPACSVVIPMLSPYKAREAGNGEDPLNFSAMHSHRLGGGTREQL